MKKYKIDGTNATLLKSIDEKRIRKKKIRGLCAYPRIVPENKVLKLLNNTNIKHPKLIKNHINSVDIEYIDGKSLIGQIDKKYLISLICNYSYEMSKVDCTTIKKYSKWTNNTEFLYYQVNNLLLVIRRSGYIEQLKELKINFDSLLSFKNLKLDDTRKLVLIHGDIKKENLINYNGQYILLDWELACYGDIAYDLALHFDNEKYTNQEIMVVVDRLSGSLFINTERFLKDIYTYMKFEKFRRSIVGFIELLELKKKKLSNEALLLQTYEYYKSIQGELTLDRIKDIIDKKN